MIEPLTLKCYPSINRLSFMRGNNYIGRVVLDEEYGLPELILEPENSEKLYLMEVQDIFNAWFGMKGSLYETHYELEGKAYKGYVGYES